MKKCLLPVVCLLACLAQTVLASVSVSSPTNGGTVQSPVHFVATGTSSCSKGVASMGIYTAPGVLAYTANGSKLDTQLSLNAGTYDTVVEEWDFCGGATTTPVKITVTNEAGVQVSSPSNNSTVSSPVHYVATASAPSCAKGVASMGIYTSAGVLAYVVNGASLNTNLVLNAGAYNTVVQEWDYCGGSKTTPITITVKNLSQVQVTSPGNNATAGSPVHFAATATSSCSKGVASMGIYTAPNQLAYVVNGASLNTSLPLNPGTYNATVEEWDNCGGASTSPVTFTVTGGSQVFSAIQAGSGWAGHIQLPPTYADCDTCSPNGPQETWWTQQGIGSPSLSGKAMEFNIGGSTPYSDVLWNVHLVGDGAPNLDQNHQIVPNVHNYTYDAYFYGTNLGLSQALEFDVNQFTNGLSFVWGHECRIAGGNQWDIWDNQNNKWVPTGIPCDPKSNDWNHVTIQVQRTADNQLLYQTITLNGQRYTLNAHYPPTSSSWYGITVNYQMDGNYAQQSYSTYLDNFNLIYW